MGAFTWQKVSQKRHGLKEAGKGQKDDIVMCYAGLCYIAPIAAAQYHSKQGSKDGEVAVVGRHGLVIRRDSRKGVAKPWLR